MKFRHKPIEIEAWHYTGDNADELHKIFGSMKRDMPRGEIGIWRTPNAVGYTRVEVGDWIVRNAEGEKFPVKPEIFEATYEPA